jgi:hypothetical protein
MKAILTVIITAFGFNLIMAQSHFFVDGARWVFKSEESYEPGQIWLNSNTEENTINGDTIIDGIRFLKLYKRYITVNRVMPPPPHPSTSTTGFAQSGPMYIRYDSIEQKLIFRETSNSADSIIYKAKMNVGERVTTGKGYLDKVLRIDSINIFGDWRKVFSLDTSSFPIRNLVIEGLGGYNGLTYHQPTFPAISGGIPMTELVCFQYRDSTFIPQWIRDNQIPCPKPSEFIASSTQPEKERSLVFPNPTNGDVMITIPNNYIGATLTLYREDGRKVGEYACTQEQLVFTITTAGRYFYVINQKRGKVSGQLIVQK